MTTTKDRVEHAPPERQLTLFSGNEPTFLKTCRPAIASGITLHALNAARTNGMAPLRLPELTDQHIPWKNRAAMVENLPTGVIAWSEGFLEQDLEAVLRNSENPNIWKASVDVLSREGHGNWLEYFDGLVSRLHKAPSQTFWAHVACCAYLVAREDPSGAAEVRQWVEQLVNGARGERSRQCSPADSRCARKTRRRNPSCDSCNRTRQQRLGVAHDTGSGPKFSLDCVFSGRRATATEMP